MSLNYEGSIANKMKDFNPHTLEPFWGNWYIDSLIGEGSFGSVYKIYREEFGKKHYCALKIISIPNSVAAEKQALYDGMDANSATEYFHEIVEVIYKEIVLMSELKGRTNIVSYEDHQILQKESGIGYHILIRMELLESLNDYMLHHSFEEREVIRLGKDLCKALILCHKRNILHRDIKPGNIFVSVDGDFKLGDFGIARQLEGTEEGLSIKGTYGYMAPEVYLGNQYDDRVDIYSLGMVLYYFLNNRKGPFQSNENTVQKYSERQESLKRRFGGEQLPKPVMASEELSKIVIKACAFGPANRYQSAEDFLLELDSLKEKIAVENIELPLPVVANIEEEGTVMEKKPLYGGDQNGEEGTVWDNRRLYKGEELEEKTIYEPRLVHNRTEEDKYIEEKNPKAYRKKRRVIIPALSILCVLLICGGVLIYIMQKGDWKEVMNDTTKEGELEEGMNDEPVDEETLELIEGYVQHLKNSIKDLNNTGETTDPDTGETTDPDTWEVDKLLYEIEVDNLGIADLFIIDDVAGLTSLSASFNQLTTLDELSLSVHLEYLNVQDNKIADIRGIQNLTSLNCLNLMNNQIKDIKPLYQLTKLEILILSGNSIKDIIVLESLTNLEELRLDQNKKINNIEPLSRLGNLKTLILSNTAIVDLSPLYGLKDLELLDITGTPITQEQIDEFLTNIPTCIVIR